MMVGGCGVIAMATAMLYAQVNEPKKIPVVGLEDDKDNTIVEAPAELGQKPETISFSADAIMANAAKSNDAAEPKSRRAAFKSLTLEGMVIPPSDENVKTLDEAVRNILGQVDKQIGTISSNGIEKLVMPYQQLGDGKHYEVEWRKALRLLLSPVGYNFTEDGELVLFGLAEEVDVKHKQLAQERLSANRTPILFTTNESEGGMELRNAIRDVAVKADVTITTDYMDPGDLFVPMQMAVAEGKLTADDIGKAKENTTVQQTQVKRTTFDTNGQQIEWRIVLREILNPHDYDFVEVGGVVRVAKRAKLAQWEQEAIAAKPLEARVIRLYHADPESVVERVLKIKGLLRHPNASLQATRKKDDDTDVVKNLNSRIQTSSGSRSGQSDTTSQVFDKLVRPRTVPAIIAYDVEENLAVIESKVKLFDIKEKQILIEAIIFQLSTDNDADGDGEMDGIQWEGFEKFVPLYGSIGNVRNIATTFADLTLRDGFGIRGSAVREGGTVNGVTYRQSPRGQVWMRTDGFDFQTMIQLIRKRDNSKLLSSPMIVVGDHSEAAIQVSQVDPVPDPESNFSDSTSASRETVNLEWLMIRSGVLMWVSPEITENGTSVRLTVHPQVVAKEAAVTFKFAGTEYFNYPLKMHEMDTRATVPSGATLMFGGLIDNEEVEEEDKVRWLGDIPWIGWFFRSKTTKVKQTNLIIMIRPTILEDTDDTGFEKNALKETESVMENSGRNLKKTPLSGPLSVKEIKKEVNDLYEERVVKPLEDGEENREQGTESGDRGE